MTKTQKATKVKKLSEWAGNISPWGCYDAKDMEAKFLKETGRAISFHGYPASVANKTVGQFKGLLEPLKGKDGKPLDGKHLIQDGWRMVHSIWEKYGNGRDSETIGMLNGRGFIASACIAALKAEKL